MAIIPLHPQKMLEQMYNYGLNGNIVDHTWYKIFRLRKGKPKDGEPQLFGKPHINAIVLLSEIAYWYRPTVSKSDSGVISLSKKFKADILQKSYDQIEESLGLTKVESRSALETLEFYGVCERVFRDLIVGGMKVSNVMFISFDPIRLKELMTRALEAMAEEKAKGNDGQEKLKKSIPSSFQNDDPLISKRLPPHFEMTTYTETTSETSSERVSVANADAPPREAAQEIQDDCPRRITFESITGSQSISQDDLFRRAVSSKNNLTTEELLYSFTALGNYKGVVRDWWRFIEGTIENYRTSIKSKNAAKAKPRDKNKSSRDERRGQCKTKIQKEQKNINPDYLESDSEGPRSRSQKSIQDHLDELLAGSQSQKGFC